MKMHLTKQLLFPIKDERLKTNDSRTHSLPVCVCAVCTCAVCSCRMRGRCEWVCSCVWHVHITCIYMCACEYRVWCICGICVCVYRVHIFSPPLVLAWASSVFGSLRARRRSGVCFIQVLLPFPLPGAPAVALVPSAHLWGPPPHLLPSLASGGSGARSPGKAEEVTLMDRIAQEAQHLQIRDRRSCARVSIRGLFWWDNFSH